MDKVRVTSSNSFVRCIFLSLVSANSFSAKSYRRRATASKVDYALDFSSATRNCSDFKASLFCRALENDCSSHILLMQAFASS